MTENNILGPRNYLYETAVYSPSEMEIMYDQWSENFDEEVNTKKFNGYNLASRYLAEYAKNHGFDKNIKILDVCCGTGYIGKVLARKYGYTNLDGVDGSTKMLAKAEKLGIYGKCVYSWIDGEKRMPIPDNTYDAAALAGAFCPSHLPLKSFYDIARVVKPGGFIVNAMRNEWTKPGQCFEQYHSVVKELAEKEIWEHVADIIPEEKYCITADIEALVSIFKVKQCSA